MAQKIRVLVKAYAKKNSSLAIKNIWIFKNQKNLVEMTSKVKKKPSQEIENILIFA